MLTIADHDRRIARLKRMLNREKVARHSLVVSAENRRRHQDPAYRERFRAARRAHDVATGRALPEMTTAQRTLYDNAKQHYHMTRAEALAFALTPSTASSAPQNTDAVRLSPREPARPLAPNPTGARISLEETT